MVCLPSSYKMVWTGHFKKATLDWGISNSVFQFSKQMERKNSNNKEKKNNQGNILWKAFLWSLALFLLLRINIIIKHWSLGLTCALQEVNIDLKCQSTNGTANTTKTLQPTPYKALSFFCFWAMHFHSQTPPKATRFLLRESTLTTFLMEAVFLHEMGSGAPSSISRNTAKHGPQTPFLLLVKCNAS